MKDAVGNLWVGDYYDFGEAQRHWTVFDPDGQHLGDIDVPDRFTIYDIGDNYILGRSVDEFDVERVVLHRLHKPAPVIESAAPSHLHRILMRRLQAVLTFFVFACAGPDEAPAPREDVTASQTPETRGSSASRNPVDYAAPIVLFVSPDSLEIDQMQTRLGENFHVVADDAMWYRANAYELLDSLRIPHTEVKRGAAQFLIDGKSKLVSWEHVEWTWFTVVYDGKAEPKFSADVDLREALFPSKPH